jgi:lipoprotein-anchoring transpeptidase ErfK/SrfK
VAGALSDNETLEAKKMIAEMSNTLIFSSRRLPGDPWIIGHLVEPGEVLAKLGSLNGLTSSFLQQINGITDPRKMRAGYPIKLVKGPFYAVVTKHAFTMDIYLGAPGGAGSMYVTTYRVGLGTDDSTPTGKWIVEPGKKLPHPTYYPPPGQGPVIEADDPHNPLGKYWIGLKGVDGQSVGRLSYGIHGTIEPESIGKQASLGCIRLLSPDIAQVFSLLVEGKSTVVVQP